MKRLLKWMGLSLGLTMAVLGSQLFDTHLRMVPQQPVTDGENGLSDAALENHVREQVRDLDKQVRVYQVQVGQTADKAAATEVAVQDLERQLTLEKQRLARIQQRLEQDQPDPLTARPAGSGEALPSRRDTEAEARALLQHCRTLEARLESQRALARTLGQTLTEGQATLAQAQRLKEEMLTGLEMARARLAGAKLRQGLGELSSELGDSPLGPASDLGRQLAAFRDRARRAELEADAVLGHLPSPRRKGDSAAEPDVRSALRSYLQADRKPTR